LDFHFVPAIKKIKINYTVVTQLNLSFLCG